MPRKRQPRRARDRLRDAPPPARRARRRSDGRRRRSRPARRSMTPAARAAAPMWRTVAASSASTPIFAFLASRGEACELLLADDLVGDEHVANAGGDERLGLADLLAADADRAALDLRVRDVRALVRLRVRAQRDAAAAHGVGHQVEVALERVEVDDERRRVDVLDGVAGTGGKVLHRADRNPRAFRAPSANERAACRSIYFATRRFGRGELTVDDVRDLEELRAVDIAGDRVAAVVVDPVEHADAVLDRVAERGLAGAGRLLAHLQRQALLVGVLVHEQRRRLLVAGDEPAADQRVADAVEIRRMHAGSPAAW